MHKILIIDEDSWATEEVKKALINLAIETSMSIDVEVRGHAGQIQHRGHIRNIDKLDIEPPAIFTKEKKKAQWKGEINRYRRK